MASFASRKVKKSDDVVAHDLMRCTAEKYVRQMFNVLNPVLIGAIVMFLAGLLFQLWDMVLSLPEIPRVLFSASIVGTSFCSAVGITLILTFLHGLVHLDSSPFSSPYITPLCQILTWSCTPFRLLFNNLFRIWWKKNDTARNDLEMSEFQLSSANTVDNDSHLGIKMHKFMK